MCVFGAEDAWLTAKERGACVPPHEAGASGEGDPSQRFQQAATRNAAYCQLFGQVVESSVVHSPEPFAQLRGGRIIRSRPVNGRHWSKDKGLCRSTDIWARRNKARRRRSRCPFAGC